MSREISDAPIKVSQEAKDMIRYGSAIFSMTMAEFTEIAVAEYLVNHQEEIDGRISDLGKLVTRVREASPLP